MSAAAAGLLAARDNGGVGVLTGGRLTVTDAYAYAKFARLALRTNDIDFRARAHSAEEAAFLAARVVGTAPERGGVTYTALETAPAVLLVALEPEEESAILFLRLRKAARKRRAESSSVGRAGHPGGLDKMSGTLMAAAPGAEAADRAVAGLEAADDRCGRRRALVEALTGGGVVLVGERAAEVPGLLTAVGELVDATGARLGLGAAAGRGARRAGRRRAAARCCPAVARWPTTPPAPRSRRPGGPRRRRRCRAAPGRRHPGRDRHRGRRGAATLGWPAC